MKNLILAILLLTPPFAFADVVVDGSTVTETKTVAEYIAPMQANVEKALADIADLQRQISERLTIIDENMAKIQALTPEK